MKVIKKINIIKCLISLSLFTIILAPPKKKLRAPKIMQEREAENYPIEITTDITEEILRDIETKIKAFMHNKEQKYFNAQMDMNKKIKKNLNKKTNLNIKLNKLTLDASEIDSIFEIIKQISNCPDGSTTIDLSTCSIVDGLLPPKDELPFKTVELTALLRMFLKSADQRELTIKFPLNLANKLKKFISSILCEEHHNRITNSTTRLIKPEFKSIEKVLDIENATLYIKSTREEKPI